MQTYEQLGRIIRQIEDGGWQRVAPNRWASPGAVYTLTTSYVWQEATLVLMNGATSAPQEPVYYRGADPLSWAETVGFPL